MAELEFHRLSDAVAPHEKSIVLGGAKVLFPVAQSVAAGHARLILDAMREAENFAFKQGYRKAQENMRKAMGITR